jgi:iron complex outermembrane receptor protein
VWSYEVGVKSDLFDRRVRANVTAFLLDVSDLQTISGLLNPVTGALTFLNRNFAGYRQQGHRGGVHLPARRRPQSLRELRLPGRSLQDQPRCARLRRVRRSVGRSAAAGVPGCAGCRSHPGRPNTAACGAGIVTAQGTIATPVRTPKYSLALGGSYELGLGDSGVALVPSVNASYRSKQEVATSNLTFFTGGITGTNGTFPAIPTAGT